MSKCFFDGCWASIKSLMKNLVRESETEVFQAANETQGLHFFLFFIGFHCENENKTKKCKTGHMRLLMKILVRESEKGVTTTKNYAGNVIVFLAFKRHQSLKW